ncbi:MAG: DUF3179 domain-containing protein [Acidimicrobiia bacterium]
MSRRVVALGLVVAACGGSAAVPSSTSAGPEPVTTGPAAPAAPAPGSGDSTSTQLAQDAGPSSRSAADPDLSLHSVPLDDVYFDTFDGGAVRLSDSTPELRARLLDAIPPIDSPVYEAASAGDEWLDDEDLVLGYVAGGTAYAYAFRILNFHEIVNDVLDDVPVLISYCPLCRSAIVYDRRIEDRVLTFGNTSALYETDLVMVDRETSSYWWQVAGSSIVGTLTGTTLDALPSSVSTWADWRTLHPETLVLSRDTGFNRNYDRDPFRGYEAIIDEGRFPFPVGDDARDPRLAASELVVGVDVGGTARAYPVGLLEGPTNDRIGDVDLVIFPTEGGASVFSAVVEGVALEFRQAGGVIEDVGTGSVWDATGVTIAGELAGTRLDPIGSRTTFWFAMVGAFPEVELWLP